MARMSDEDAKKKLFELLKDIRVAMLATRGANGRMTSRPMWTGEARAFTGELWFLTSVESGKVHDLERDPEVLLTYADDRRQHYVSVSGSGELVRDRNRLHGLWSEGARAWFPRGPDDPDLAAIRVAVESAEYWDSPSSTMVHLYGYIKAVTTGQRPNPGENESVTYR